MDIKKHILEVLNNNEKATTKDIADKYLLQPREKVDCCLKQLQKEWLIVYYDYNWYLIDKLLDKLIKENNLLRDNIQDITYQLGCKSKNRDDLL